MKIIGVPPKQAGMYIFGGLLLAVGIGLCIYGLVKPGIASIVAGVGLIICGVLIDTAPWVFVIAGIIGLAWLGYLIYHTVATHKTATATAAKAEAQQTTLESVVPAVHDLTQVSPQWAAWLKKRVDHHTATADETTVKSVVNDIKSDLNLVPPPTIAAGMAVANIGTTKTATGGGAAEGEPAVSSAGTPPGSPFVTTPTAGATAP